MAEDVTQETFLRFPENSNYCERGQKIRYLYTIAHNLCIDTYRAKQTEQLDAEVLIEDKEDEILTGITIKEAVSQLEKEEQGEFLKHRHQHGKKNFSNLSFVMAQFGYIPKYVWGIFSFTFGIAIVCGCFMEKDVLWIISALIPFIAMSILTENARSGIYLMAELEMAARFSLKSVILARMEILGKTSVI